MSSQLLFKSIQYSAQSAGPRLIVTGAVHGNETCGTVAIRRLMAELDDGSLALQRGSLTLVPVTNPLAYAQGSRAGERNLNRSLFPNAAPQDFEDRVANWLCPLLASHDVLLDLHSFQSGSEAFVMVGPRDNDGPLEPFQHAEQERALARRLGVRRCVDGWLRTYGAGVRRRLHEGADVEQVLGFGVGTTEYMRSTGGYALTLECGQHADPQAPEVAYRAIRNTLAFLGLVEAAPVPASQMEALSMVEVVDKQHAADAFSQPWASFDRLRAGQEIGRRADGGVVTAPYDCRILFPDSEAGAHSEWYYLSRDNPDF